MTYHLQNPTQTSHFDLQGDPNLSGGTEKEEQEGYKQTSHSMRFAERFYLNQENDEEVKVGDSPELLEHVLGDEVPKRVLQKQKSRI